ncbi:MAG: FAD-binding oxidoreductase [Micavibrio sp.]
MDVAVKKRNHNSGAVIDLLRAEFGERVSTTAAVCLQHGDDLTWHKAEPPDAVVFPQTTEEISKIVRLCRDHGVPVIAYGTGTSLEGHINAPYGGVCIDLSGLNKILEVNQSDLDVCVEAGVTRKQLNQHLRDTGLFFPIDPGADASLGGMAATRASGTNAVRYGTMRDNILGLTAVMPDGEILRLKGRARKSSAGYDLTALLIGSEGTLGIITEVCLRLHGIPETIAGGVCPFPSVRAACDAAIMAIQIGLPVARIELMDEVQIRASNAHSKLTLPETAALFVEFHGSEAGVKEQSESFAAIAGEFGGGPFDWATIAEDRNRLWTARHDALWAAKELRPGKQMIVTDVCVPISRLADCVEETQSDLKESGLTAPIVGHVGDGNFHLFLLVDTEDKTEMEKTEALLHRLVERAMAMDGTCTGEHGVGKGKMKYLEAEHGREAVALMRTIKRAIDPDNIMNPGKVIAF